MNQHDETIQLKWDHFGSLHRFNLKRSEWQFSKLLEKIRTIQPLFNDTLGYIDDDGDCILVSTSLEMDAMLELSKGRNEKVVRIKTISVNKPEENNDAPKSPEKEIHPNIMCDLCDKFIAGIRYKCLSCDDYDLCEDCEKTGLHPEHPMLRLANPRTPKGPFECRRRFMRRGFRHSANAPTLQHQRCPFTPDVLTAVRNATAQAAATPQQNAEAPNAPPRQNGEPRGVEYLRDVGTMIQQVLGNFGIDCDLSIEHGNKREKIPQNESKDTQTLEKAPEMVSAPLPNAEPPKQEDAAQKAAHEVADRTTRESLDEAIQAATTDVLKKATEALDMATEKVNNFVENPQNREEMEKIVQNAAQATQFAISQAAEIVKRNSTYMAEHADNPQFRSFMANVSQWADQLAQFYPGIVPQPAPANQGSPPPEYAEKQEPTAPVAEEPKVDAQMESIHENVMSASHISTATAVEPEEELLIEIEPKTNENASKVEVMKTWVHHGDGEYTDDSDVEVISSRSGSARASPPPSTTPAAPQNTSAMNPFMEDDGWLLMNKSYEELCKIYEAKREAEEKRRKEIEEQIEIQRKEHERLMKEKIENAQKEQASSGSLYPQLHDEECTAGIPYSKMPATVRPHSRICAFKHPNQVVQDAVDHLEAMGYDNCNGWLTRLSEKCLGDISMVLDEAAKDPLHLARLD